MAAQTKKTSGAGKYASAVTKKVRGVTVSTGGGEPIDPGEKWTDEDRDLEQPRTSDGKFGTKAMIGAERKTEPHPWRGTYAEGSDMNPKGKKLSEDEKKKIWEKNHKQTDEKASDIKKNAPDVVKAGTEFAAGDKVFYVVEDMDKQEIIDGLRDFWKDNEGKGHFANDLGFAVKKGRHSKEEETALSESQVGPQGQGSIIMVKGKSVDISNVKSANVKAEIDKAIADRAERKKLGYPTFNPMTVVKKGKSPNAAANAALNAKIRAAKQNSPAPAAQAPASPASAPAAPAAPAAPKKPGAVSSQLKGDAKDAGFYDDNKDILDDIAKQIDPNLTGKELADLIASGDVSYAELDGLFE